MDQHRFDGLARVFGASTSRRAAIAAAFGLIGFGAAAPTLEAEANTCRRPRQACGHSAPCCDGSCPMGRDTPLRNRHRCPCPGSDVVCDNKCVDLASDERHCGHCRHRCMKGETCCSGVCMDISDDEDNCGACGQICADAETCCGDVCTTLRDDEDHCGACGVTCPTGETCVSGICVHHLPPV